MPWPQAPGGPGAPPGLGPVPAAPPPAAHDGLAGSHPQAHHAALPPRADLAAEAAGAVPGTGPAAQASRPAPHPWAALPDAGALRPSPAPADLDLSALRRQQRLDREQRGEP